MSILPSLAALLPEDPAKLVAEIGRLRTELERFRTLYEFVPVVLAVRYAEEPDEFKIAIQQAVTRYDAGRRLLGAVA